MLGGMDPIVDASWLASRLGEVVVCDVRWYLDGRSGLAAYAAGHLPGAVFVDLDAVLAGPPGRGTGRHPLPDPDVFAAAMGALGVGDETPVVAYDDAGGTVAARLVWLLRVIGHPAALLDGGIDAWPGRLSAEPASHPHRRFTPRPVPATAIVDADTVAAAAAAPGAVVLDARAAPRYRGELEPIDPRAGHVPGARSLPATATLTDRGTLDEARFLEAAYREVGIGRDTDVVVYCGSGINACHHAVVLEHLGLGRVRVYPGSWSQWSSDPARPVATGDEP
jgi:thiosulfate/3-mercaptopyruvate sulfurtransferase